MYEKGSFLRKIIEKLVMENHISISTRLQFSNNAAVKKAVEVGAGIAMMSRQAADKEIRSGKLCAVRLSDAISKRSFYMIYRKNKTISSPIQHFMVAVSRCVKNRGQVLDNKLGSVKIQDLTLY